MSNIDVNRSTSRLCPAATGVRARVPTAPRRHCAVLGAHNVVTALDLARVRTRVATMRGMRQHRACAHVTATATREGARAPNAPARNLAMHWACACVTRTELR